MVHSRTDADNVRDWHNDLLRGLDRAHNNLHQQMPGPSSIAYRMIASDLEDAMKAAQSLSGLLERKGL